LKNYLLNNNKKHNNSMDVRAKQRLCLLACPLNSELRVGGFAPRHLSRWASSVFDVCLIAAEY